MVILACGRVRRRIGTRVGRRSISGDVGVRVGALEGAKVVTGALVRTGTLVGTVLSGTLLFDTGRLVGWFVVGGGWVFGISTPTTTMGDRVGRSVIRRKDVKFHFGPM